VSHFKIPHTTPVEPIKIEAVSHSAERIFFKCEEFDIQARRLVSYKVTLFCVSG
jgi:hypothetical protein